MSEVHTLPDWTAALTSADDDLAATVASRICHDITSPLGAIANGVELLALSGQGQSPEMALIAESVESANARIRFFRMAFGTAGPQPVGRTEVVRTLAALSRNSRLAYEWAAQGDHPRSEIKAVFLLLQCLEASMPLGGRIRTERETDTWRVTAEGSRLKSDLPAWDSLLLGNQIRPRGASQVQFALLGGLLGEMGRSLELRFAPDCIEARL